MSALLSRSQSGPTLPTLLTHSLPSSNKMRMDVDKSPGQKASPSDGHPNTVCQGMTKRSGIRTASMKQTALDNVCMQTSTIAKNSSQPVLPRLELTSASKSSQEVLHVGSKRRPSSSPAETSNPITSRPFDSKSHCAQQRSHGMTVNAKNSAVCDASIVAHKYRLPLAEV